MLPPNRAARTGRGPTQPFFVVMSVSLAYRFANPGRFQRLAEGLLPWLRPVTILLFIIGVFLALIHSPPDYQQGETVRIMYVHVPAAWMSLFVYITLAAAALAALAWRHPLAEVYARAAAPIGCVFAAVCLITGSLWGEPMWGRWWVWDARLTSMLVLFFLYVGHIAVTHAFDDIGRGARAASIIALVGVVNVPIVKFSVDWWATLHQGPSVFRSDGPAIDPAMLVPLAVMALAYHAFYVTVVLTRMRAELLRRRVTSMVLGGVAPNN